MTWLIRRLGISPWITTQLLVTSFFINLLGLASSVFVIQVYGRYLVHGIDATLLTLSTGMLLVIVIEFALRRIRYRMAMAISAQPERESSSRLFQTLLHAKADDVMNLKPGFRQMIMRRNEQVLTTTGPSLFVSLIDTPFIVLYLIAMFMISVSVGWWALLIILITLVTAVLLGFRLKENTQAHMRAQIEQSEVTNSAGRFEAVRNSGAASFLQNQWDSHSSKLRWWKYKMGREQELLQNLVQSMTILITVVVISLGAREVAAGNLDFGMLIGLNILAARALAILARPAQSISSLLQAEQSRQLVDNFLNTPVEPPQGAQLNHYSGNLTLKDVTFGYQGGDGPVIQQCTVNIPAGSFVRVIGGNGSGKTTLCRLITNLLSPRRGAVLADGVDVRQFHPQWWRRQIIYVPQEPEFMDTTLRQNLTMLNPGIDEKGLSEVIGLAGLRQFIDQSREGLDMQVSDGGRHFSLGIRRRIALAQAMVANGPLVLIDDPAEGLDAEGTQMIGRLLNEYSKQGRTIIVTTHDANSIKGSGITIDLNNGAIPVVTEG